MTTAPASTARQRPSFRSFEWRRFSLHAVPRGNESDRMRLSTRAVDASPEVARFVTEEVSKAISRAGAAAELDGSVRSPVPEAVRRIMASADHLLAESQSMAHHLCAVQTSVNPEGLLATFAGTLEGRPGVAVLKLEHEEGLRQIERELEGRLELSIELVEDLLLTRSTSVFKVAVFLENERSKGGPSIWVADPQSRARGAMTQFFLSKFLGLRLVDDAGQMTRRFYDAALRAIDKTVETPPERAEARLALLLELASRRSTVDPLSFASRHLPSPTQDAFVRHLEAAEIEAQPFSKDTGLIERRIERLRYEFESGVMVLVPPHEIGASVEVSESDGVTEIRIRGKLAK